LYHTVSCASKVKRRSRLWFLTNSIRHSFVSQAAPQKLVVNNILCYTVGSFYDYSNFPLKIQIRIFFQVFSCALDTVVAVCHSSLSSVILMHYSTTAPDWCVQWRN